MKWLAGKTRSGISYANRAGPASCKTDEDEMKRSRETGSASDGFLGAMVCFGTSFFSYVLAKRFQFSGAEDFWIGVCILSFLAGIIILMVEDRN